MQTNKDTHTHTPRTSYTRLYSIRSNHFSNKTTFNKSLANYNHSKILECVLIWCQCECCNLQRKKKKLKQINRHGFVSTIIIFTYDWSLLLFVTIILFGPLLDCLCCCRCCYCCCCLLLLELFLLFFHENIVYSRISQHSTPTLIRWFQIYIVVYFGQAIVCVFALYLFIYRFVCVLAASPYSNTHTHTDFYIHINTITGHLVYPCSCVCIQEGVLLCIH